MRKVRVQRECSQTEVSAIGVWWCMADFRWDEGLDLCEPFDHIDHAELRDRLKRGGVRQKTAKKREASFYYVLGKCATSDHTCSAA